ncbi:MAG: tetratricopeptide repeat protein [Terracidiphilus sp.]
MLPSATSKALWTLALLTLLVVCQKRIQAQEGAPEFGDLISRAAEARDQQNLSLAIELYNQAVQLRPDWGEGWWYLGLLQYNSNRFAPAIESFNHLLELQPGMIPAKALRGLCEFETAAYDDSRRDLEQAVALGAANEPRNGQIIRYHLAQLLTRAGRFEDAVAQYRFFASLTVDDPELLVGLGVAGMRVNSLSRDVPSSDKAFYEAAGKAGFAFMAGNIEESDTLFDRLFLQYPKTANLHLFYAMLVSANAPDVAIGLLQREVLLAPANSYAHGALAMMLMLAGRYGEAVPEGELALAAAPDSQMVQLALGRSLIETGNTKRGSELLNKVLERDPNNLEAHMGLATAYVREGRLDDAYHERRVCLGLAR